MNIPKPTSSYIILKVTSDDKFKEGMMYVIELDQKTELRIVYHNNSFRDAYLNVISN